jgi:hypothetical protein
MDDGVRVCMELHALGKLFRRFLYPDKADFIPATKEPSNRFLLIICFDPHDVAFIVIAPLFPYPNGGGHLVLG